jgi:O-antigen/teichoic acid export membrane protein
VIRGDSLSGDTRTALRNAAKLAVSLLATWSVGIVVRFWLPRHLGPEQFGLFSFAEGLAATALVGVTLGIDTYIQKEIPIRPAIASDFYGGILVMRAILSALLIGGLLLMPIGDRPPEVRYLLVVFGVGHFAFSINHSLAALLQANATVDEVARTNVGTKLLWGLGMFSGILLGLPLIAFAVVFAASEIVKAAFLQLAARRRLDLRIRVDAKASVAVVVASLGFYASTIAHILGQRLDIALLGFLAQDAEVGWYGSSQTLASITLLLTPVLGAVLTPLYARSLSRSQEELLSVLRRALEGIVSVTAPVALFLALGAELWVRIAFGADYAPAAGSLRMLAPLFVLIYVSILLAARLVVEGRGWTLTTVAVVGVSVNAVSGWILTPLFGAWFGPGGAGSGMALAGVVKEVVVVACFLVALGVGTIDKQRWSVIGRTALTAAATTAVHIALAPLGHWRLLADALAYAVLAVLLGAIRPRMLVSLARELMPRSQSQPSAGDATPPE